MKKNTNEFLFSLYLWIFAIAKPIGNLFENSSFIILLSSTIIIIAISFFQNKFQYNKKNLASIGVISLFLIVLLLDALFRRNGYTFQIIYEYTIYGLVTMYLYSFVKNKKETLLMFSKVSIVVFFIYLPDPFVGYELTSDYMTYGFEIALPVFCGIYIGRKFFAKKTWIIFEIPAFLLLFTFSNRGAILTAICFLIISNLAMVKMSIKQIYKLIILSVATFLLAVNFVYILNIINDFINQQGYYSYSLVRFINTINSGDLIASFSGRDAIWDRAIAFIKEYPLLGNGIGSFQEMYGYYSHNFVLDILIYYGSIGLIIFIIISILGLYKTFYLNKGYNRLFGILFLTMWIIPLSTSSYIFRHTYFWVFISIALIDKIKMKPLKQ